MIYALVTLYNPDNEVCKNINHLIDQVDKVFLCDNSLVSNERSFVDSNKVNYLFFGENLGISKAFNTVLTNEEYKFNNDDFVIFFDQDSCIDEGHINKLLDIYNDLIDKNYPVGCVSPCFFNTNNNSIEKPKFSKKVLDGVVNVKGCITSSMLCKYGNLKKIDFWNEDIFLDMADWDLCWRMMKNGLLCFMTDKVILNHTLGIGEKKILWFHIRNCSPIREYYQVREGLYLLKKKYVPLKFRIKIIKIVFIYTYIHLFVLPDKKIRFNYIFRGYKDFLKNIHGEYIGEKK